MRVREKRKSGVYLRRNSVSVNTTKRNIILLPILQWYFSSSDYSSFITIYIIIIIIIIIFIINIDTNFSKCG